MVMLTFLWGSSSSNLDVCMKTVTWSVASPCRQSVSPNPWCSGGYWAAGRYGPTLLCKPQCSLAALPKAKWLKCGLPIPLEKHDNCKKLPLCNQYAWTPIALSDHSNPQVCPEREWP